MKIILTSIFVRDQAKALKFYTETLGFVKKSDVTNGAIQVADRCLAGRSKWHRACA